MKQISFTSSFKTSIAIIVFLAIGGGLFYLLGEVIIKDPEEAQRWYAVYDTDEELEVVFFGNSHSFVSFDTRLLTEVGINSAHIGGSSERFPSTYYNVMEVLKYKKPKLVVIELNALFYPKDLVDEKVIHYNIENLYGMKYGTNRFQETLEVINPDNYVHALFPQILHHDNWKKFYQWKDNYAYNKEKQHALRGYVPSQKLIQDEDWNEDVMQNRNFIYATEKFEPRKIPAENLALFKKLLVYCDSIGIEVLLTKAPVARSEWKGLSTACEEISEQFNKEVVDYNLLCDELAFEQNDFRDTGHVNSSGARKITNHFLSEVLVKKYHILPDFANSMALKNSSVVLESGTYRYEVEFYNPNLIYAFYLYKDGEKIDTKWYSKEAFYEFTPEQHGEYSVKYFAVTDTVTDPSADIKEDKVFGIFAEKVVIK